MLILVVGGRGKNYRITHPLLLCLYGCNLHMQVLYKVLHKNKLSKMKAYENILFYIRPQTRDMLFL